MKETHCGADPWPAGDSGRAPGKLMLHMLAPALALLPRTMAPTACMPHSALAASVYAPLATSSGDTAVSSAGGACGAATSEHAEHIAK